CGNVPASLEKILVNDHLVLTTATVLRHAEDDVRCAVEPRRPRPPRPDAQALEFWHGRKHTDKPLAQRRDRSWINFGGDRFDRRRYRYRRSQARLRENWYRRNNTRQPGDV